MICEMLKRATDSRKFWRCCRIFFFVLACWLYGSVRLCPCMPAFLIRTYLQTSQSRGVIPAVVPLHRVTAKCTGMSGLLHINQRTVHQC